MITLTKATAILETRLGPSGRLLSMSKGSYRHANPSHVAVFNAHIFLEGFGSIWRGDLDLSVEPTEAAMSDLARAAGGLKVYLLNESAGHAGGTISSDKAVWTGYVDELSGRLNCVFNEDRYVRDQNGRLIILAESVDVIILRELDRVAHDRASVVEEDLLSHRLTFPYLEMAHAAKASGKKAPEPLNVYIDSITAFAAGLELEDLHLSAVMHADDFDLLNKSMIRRLKKTHGFLSEYGLQKEISWAMFQWGPRSFVKGGTPDCVPVGQIRFMKPRTER